MEVGPLLIEVRCVPRRRWVTLLLDDGIAEKIPRRLAMQMIRMGELKVVGKRPLTVSIPKNKNFAEEQRYCSGRRIPGITRGMFNDKASISSGLRCKPPRSVLNREYVKTIGWVRQAQKKMADKEDRDREEKERKKKAKERRRQMRKILILFLFMAPALGQANPVTFPSPFFWDANTDGVTATYGVYSSGVSCVDPNPSPDNCVAFSQVDAVPHTPLTVCSPDCITWTDPGAVVFGQSTFYRVTALNSSGGESAFSDELEVEWLEPIPDVPGKPRTTTTLTFIVRENGPQIAEVVGKFYSPGKPRIRP
jgi:hypothetical protein